MSDLKDTCLVISARLESSRIPQKMIKPFAETTLLDIALKKITSSTVISNTNVFLATRREELVEIGNKYSVNIFERSLESVNSEGQNLSQLYEWHDKLDFKRVVLLNPCAPLLRKETIEDFFVSYSKCESSGMFGVVEKNNYFWNSSGKLMTEWPGGLKVMNTKFVDSTYEAAHCLYGSRLDSIKEGLWMGDFTKPGDVELFVIDEKETYDIDYPWQFDVTEAIYKDSMKVR